jgi:hypothetical protein
VQVVESACALESGQRVFEVAVSEDVSLEEAGNAFSFQVAVVNEVF